MAQPLVLAIEPDVRQAAIVKRIVREKIMADVAVVDSREAAMDMMRTTIPDVLLLSALMSPRDEDELIAHLRTLENADHLLKPGLFARAEILPEPRTALVLPRAALLGGASERFVFVAEDGRAVRRAVQTRELDARRVEVLGGLSEGDRVLLGPNLPKVSDGCSISLEVASVDR